jgi:hypothetical protein
VLRKLRVLEEDDVIVGSRGGDGIPHTLQGLLVIVGLELDGEHADLIGRGDFGFGESGRELLPSLAVSRRPVVQQQHVDRVPLGHEGGNSTSPAQRQTRAMDGHGWGKTGGGDPSCCRLELVGWITPGLARPDPALGRLVLFVTFGTAPLSSPPERRIEKRAGDHDP